MDLALQGRLAIVTGSSVGMGRTIAQVLASEGAQTVVARRETLLNTLKDEIVARLHYLAYYPVKAAHPTLVSDLINQARVKAAEALRSAFALRKDVARTVSQPQSDACPPRYNTHTYRVDWSSRTVRLSTTDGRQTLRFSVPAYAEKYAGFPTDTADLLSKRGRCYLHIVVTLPTPWLLSSDAVMGVDVGLAQPAVTSTPAFLGERRWKDIEGQRFTLKRQLQRQGTPSAQRHLRHLRGKQARCRRDCDHVLSKHIVQAWEPGATIVIENLTDIRRRTKSKRKTETARRVHSWSFAQVCSFLEYKAEERGCTVVAVDPRHTRRRAPAAGIPLVTTVVLAVALCVGCVTLRCMPTSMRPGILRPSTMPASVHLGLTRRRQSA